MTAGDAVTPPTGLRDRVLAAALAARPAGTALPAAPPITPAGGSGSCLASSRVRPTAARQVARVAPGLRPASRSAAGWVDAT